MARARAFGEFQPGALLVGRANEPRDFFLGGFDGGFQGVFLKLGLKTFPRRFKMIFHRFFPLVNYGIKTIFPKAPDPKTASWA